MASMISFAVLSDREANMPPDMEPAHALPFEQVLPVEVPGREQRRRLVGTVVPDFGSPHTHPPVAVGVRDARAAQPVKGKPAVERFDAGPAHLLLRPPPRGVLHVRGRHRRAHAERAGEIGRDIVFPPRAVAFEMGRQVQWDHAGVEALDDGPQGEQVPPGTSVHRALPVLP